jgi:3',5'-cyclic-AMP phosphodiesterase
VPRSPATGHGSPAPRVEHACHAAGRRRKTSAGPRRVPDRVDYLGVTYLCNGAVCGAWWKGANQECETGYGLIDLYADGTFAHQYVTFPWTPVPEPGDKS